MEQVPIIPNNHVLTEHDLIFAFASAVEKYQAAKQQAVQQEIHRKETGSGKIILFDEVLVDLRSRKVLSETLKQAIERLNAIRQLLRDHKLSQNPQVCAIEDGLEAWEKQS